MNDERLQAIRPLVAILVVVVVVAALRATTTVTMPVALAIFIVILTWPLQRLLERKRVPRTLAYIITFSAVALAFACFVGLLYLCVQSVAAKAPQYEDRFAAIYEQVKSWIVDIRPNADSNGVEEGASTGMILQALRAAMV